MKFESETFQFRKKYVVSQLLLSLFAKLFTIYFNSAKYDLE